jgi:4-hydroxy-tetrahydrodipicolinate synthase
MPERELRLGGSVVALATPFRKDVVDDEAVAALCERQVARGTSAIVVCGSTGEASALRLDEHGRVICGAVAAVRGRVPVIAGCTGQSTAASAVLAEAAARSGADGLLCAAPPYVKPTQQGLVCHMRVISHASDLPIVFYDVPGRTSFAAADDTIAMLFDRGFIVGIKDATADLARPPRLRALCGTELVQLSGDDATSGAYRAAGGHGCISVTANLVPALCALLHAAWEAADLRLFAETRDRLASLSDALFLESNPIPLKAALALRDLAGGETRLPLTAATADTRRCLATALAIVMPFEEALARRARYAVVG